MGESVVANSVALTVNPLGEPGKLVGLDSYEKKSRRNVLAFEHIQDFWGPLGIRTIVKCENHLVGTRPVAGHPIGLRQRVKGLIGDQARPCIQRDVARAVGRPGFDVQDFAEAIHVNVLAWGNIFELGRGTPIAGNIPNTP